MANKTAIRLGVEGGTEAKASFDAFKRDGQSAFAGVGDVAESTAKRVTNSYTRAINDVEAANARLATAAAKIAAIAPKSAIQMQIEASSGSIARGGVVEQPIGARGGGQYEGSAKASAAVFAAAAADQDRYAASAAKIKAALDPAWQAQLRLNQELREARGAFRAGALSAEDLAREELRLKAAMDQVAGSAGRQTSSIGQRKAGFQQLGYQIQDVTAQAATGTSALIILAQQGGQVAQAVDMIGAKGKLGAFAAFMGGPWGAVILGAVSIGGMLASTLLKSGDAADKAAPGINRYSNSLIDLAARAKDANKAIGDMNATSGSRRVSEISDTQRDVLLLQSNVARLEERASASGTRAALQRAAATKGELTAQRNLLAERTLQLKLLKDNDARVTAEERRRADASGATSGRSAAAGMAVDQARLSTATTETKRAEAALAIVRREGAAAVKAGALSQAEYRAQLEGGMAAVNAARDADRGAAAGKRDGAAAARELTSALDALQTRYDPAAARARDFAKTMADITAGEGRLGKDLSEMYRIGLRRDAWKQEEADLDRKVQDTLPGLGISAVVDIAPKFDADEMTKGLEGIGAKAMGLSGMMGDLRGSALRFVNTLDPADWENWGRSGRSVISMVKGELIKLALINPLKNLLSGGSSLPTIASSIGKLGALFGGGGVNALSFAGNVTEGVSSSILGAGSIAPLGFNAAGTPWWSGGATWVGENGPEIINAPRGSRITPAGQARQMVAANNENRRLQVDVSPSQYFDVRVRELASPIAAAAAQQGAANGAAGGAAIGQAEQAAAARRKLGRGWGG